MCVENWVALELGAYQMRTANLNLKSRKMWAACCWHFICFRDRKFGHCEWLKFMVVFVLCVVRKLDVEWPVCRVWALLLPQEPHIYRLSFSDPKIIARNISAFGHWIMVDRLMPFLCAHFIHGLLHILLLLASSFIFYVKSIHVAQRVDWFRQTYKKWNMYFFLWFYDAIEEMI